MVGWLVGWGAGVGQWGRGAGAGGWREEVGGAVSAGGGGERRRWGCHGKTWWCGGARGGGNGGRGWGEGTPSQPMGICPTDGHKTITAFAETEGYRAITEKIGGKHALSSHVRNLGVHTSTHHAYRTTQTPALAKSEDRKMGGPKVARSGPHRTRLWANIGAVARRNLTLRSNGTARAHQFVPAELLRPMQQSEAASNQILRPVLGLRTLGPKR